MRKLGQDLGLTFYWRSASLNTSWWSINLDLTAKLQIQIQNTDTNTKTQIQIPAGGQSINLDVTASKLHPQCSGHAIQAKLHGRGAQPT